MPSLPSPLCWAVRGWDCCRRWVGRSGGILVFAYVLIVFLILSPLLNFPEKFAGKLGEKLHDIRLGMGALLHHRLALSGTIVLSFVVQFFSILTFWLFARALGAILFR